MVIAKKILSFIFLHKVIAIMCVVGLVGGGVWVWRGTFNRSGETRYVLAQAEKGSVVVSLSGSGQVASSNQVDVKPQASGKVLAIRAAVGKEIKANTIMIQLDASDALKSVRDANLNLQNALASAQRDTRELERSIQNAEQSVRDAKLNLESAQLALEKLKKPADDLLVLQAENGLAQAEEVRQQAKDALQKAYEDGYSDVSSAYLDLPSIMTGIEDMFYTSTLDRHSDNLDWYANQIPLTGNGERDRALKYKEMFSDAYIATRSLYETNFDRYKSASRTSDSNVIETLVEDTYGTAKNVADMVKSGKTYVDYVRDVMRQRNSSVPSGVTAHQSTLSSYTATANNTVLDVLSRKSSVDSALQSLKNAERTAQEKTAAFAKLKAGADSLDIRTQESVIVQRENAYRDAQVKLVQEKVKIDPHSPEARLRDLTLSQRKASLADARDALADYVMRAPLDGIVATIPVKIGEQVSSATVVTTLIARQKIAEISLNEIDAAKVKIEQKATVTFDAVPDLSISGTVVEIDTVGSVSQGVVTYNAKIAFDTQDDRIKPGMTVATSIIIESRSNVLRVPNSALKKDENGSYVEVAGNEDAVGSDASMPRFLSTVPSHREVSIGLANDEHTVILEGIREGETVVARTIQQTSKQPSQQQQSPLFGAPSGGGRGGTAGFRAR